MSSCPAPQEIPPRPVIEHARIVVFDGICPLCCASMRFIYRHDVTGTFRFATAQSPPGRDIFKWCGLPTDHYETMVYIEQGTAYRRSEAMLRIMRHLPQPWRLLSVARWCPRFVRDGFYNVVANSRYRLFGQRDACLLPTGDLSSRFL